MKNVVIAGCLIAVLLGCALCAPIAAGVALVKKCNETKTVVVDAGHGGADGGVQGKSTGVYEKTINLTLSNFLGEMLQACGFRVVYTRRNDVMHTFDGISDNKKRADMFKRGRIINEAKPCAVVSIHMNFYSLPTRRGAQVFFSKSNEKSREFANAVQGALNAKLNLTDGGRAYGALCAEKYVLECCRCPSVIVECGFLSNYADETNLQKPEYQMRIASILCEAIATFANAL